MPSEGRGYTYQSLYTSRLEEASEQNKGPDNKPVYRNNEIRRQAERTSREMFILIIQKLAYKMAERETGSTSNQ